MPYSIVLYTRSGAFEPGNRYYLTASPVPNQAAIAEGLADAQAYLIPTSVSITRWELLDSAGIKLDEGVLSTAGTVVGEYSSFKYCSLIRLASAGPERPSTKFIHPLPESFLNNGVVTAACLTQVGLYANGLLAYDVADSEGNAVTGAIFRSGSRRKRVRLAE